MAGAGCVRAEELNGVVFNNLEIALLDLFFFPMFYFQNWDNSLCVVAGPWAERSQN
jgi:hypothetical protein